MADIETPKWRDKSKAGALMARLLRHAQGEVDMTTTQIRAAEIFLKKTIPDIARTELTGKDGGAIEHKDSTPNDKEIIAQYLKGNK